MTDYRVSARKRGYDNTWDKAARLYRRANPLCVGCLALGRIEPATLVDHIEPHKGNQAKFWDQAGNWQSSCDWHHNSIKKQLEALWERGAIPAAELKLDSAKAISLSLSTPKLSIVDDDGWPI